jgi:hypothetical protein
MKVASLHEWEDGYPQKTYKYGKPNGRGQAPIFVWSFAKPSKIIGLMEMRTPDMHRL